MFSNITGINQKKKKGDTFIFYLKLVAIFTVKSVS